MRVSASLSSLLDQPRQADQTDQADSKERFGAALLPLPLPLPLLLLSLAALPFTAS